MLTSILWPSGFPGLALRSPSPLISTPLEPCVVRINTFHYLGIDPASLCSVRQPPILAIAVLCSLEPVEKRAGRICIALTVKLSATNIFSSLIRASLSVLMCKR